MFRNRRHRGNIRPPAGFTLVELLTVMAIIAILVAVMVPAVSRFRKESIRGQGTRIVESIAAGVNTYHQDFGDYPPSEPDRVDYTRDDVPDNISGFYGSAAVVLYLNGRVSYESSSDVGYKLRQDTTNWYGGDDPYNKEKRWAPRVTGVRISTGRQSAIRGSGGWAAAGFLDNWDNLVEYFRAYRTRGVTTDKIYPRAVDSDMTGSGGGHYKYVCPGGAIISGYDMRIPVQRWFDSTYEDYRSGWPQHSTPVNASNFLVISSGADGVFGNDDDIGNWTSQ